MDAASADPITPGDSERGKSVLQAPTLSTTARSQISSPSSAANAALPGSMQAASPILPTAVPHRTSSFTNLGPHSRPSTSTSVSSSYSPDFGARSSSVIAANRPPLPALSVPQPAAAVNSMTSPAPSTGPSQSSTSGSGSGSASQGHLGGVQVIGMTPPSASSSSSTAGRTDQYGQLLGNESTDSSGGSRVALGAFSPSGAISELPPLGSARGSSKGPLGHAGSPSAPRSTRLSHKDSFGGTLTASSSSSGLGSASSTAVRTRVSKPSNLQAIARSNDTRLATSSRSEPSAGLDEQAEDELDGMARGEEEEEEEEEEMASAHEGEIEGSIDGAEATHDSYREAFSSSARIRPLPVVGSIIEESGTPSTSTPAHQASSGDGPSRSTAPTNSKAHDASTVMDTPAAGPGGPSSQHEASFAASHSKNTTLPGAYTATTSEARSAGAIPVSATSTPATIGPGAQVANSAFVGGSAGAPPASAPAGTTDLTVASRSARAAGGSIRREHRSGGAESSTDAAQSNASRSGATRSATSTLRTTTAGSTSRQGGSTRIAEAATTSGDRAVVNSASKSQSSSRALPALPSAPGLTAAPPPAMYWSKAPVHGSVPRRSFRAHTASLADEVLWLFGGCDSKGCFRDLWCFDTETMCWSKPKVTGDLPPPRRAHSATMVDRRLFVFAGGDGPHYYNDLYVFDTVSLRWSKPVVSGTAPSPRRAHTSNYWNGQLLIFGGGNGVGALNDVFALDIGNMDRLEWKKVECQGKIPIGRGYHTSNLIDGKLIVIGGSDGHMSFNDIHILRLDTKVWYQVKTDEIHNRLGHTATQVGSYLFVIGGHNSHNYTPEILTLNLVNLQWEPRRVCGRKPPGRGYHQAWLRDSRLFIHGGFDGKEIYDDLYYVDLAACAYLPQITSFSVELDDE
ncbi:Kelch repeat-containing proteins [Ceraceosorus bombacis]|uniref:Kelch repeat-containing proteins n=1 Tax=Ceraceosorus bombacis TaxID=401625 RepID=A0A0P1BAT1_9BASI|nr:Kelch repeat-containing proteins [Ceraceosorus bombacis]